MTRAGRLAAFGVVLAGFAGLAVWLLRPAGPGPGPGPEPGDLATEGAGEPAAPKPAELAGLGGGTGHAGSRPGRLPRGEGAILGTVRLGGIPVAARVSVLVDYVGPGYVPWRRSGAAWYERAFALPPTAASAAAVVRAGADGRFTVTEVGAGAFTLLAETEDGATGTTLALVPAEGARVEVTIPVAGGPETLRGRVVHADGRPFGGTVVVGVGAERSLSFGPAQGRVVPVDVEGRFVATGLPAGPVSVTAQVAGRLVVRGAALTLPHAGEYVLTVDAGLRSVAGRVVRAEDEAPVAGAEVLAGGPGSAQSLAYSRATTADDGRFEAWLPEGRGGGLFVRAEGFAPQQRQVAGNAEAEPLVIRLVRGAAVTGSVTREADGAPVPGLGVTVLPIGSQRGSAIASEPATTDAEGRYTATGLTPGEAMVVAQGQGWVTKGLDQATRQGFNPFVFLLKGGETVTADVVVTTGARIDGVVLDAAGAPVAGAVVLASSQTAGSYSFGELGYGIGPGPVASGRDGRFSIEGAVPGIPCVLSAEAPGFTRAQALPVTPVAGTTSTVEIRFAAARFVDVTVLDDAAGTPVAGARLLAASWGASMSGAPPTFATASDGRCRVGPVPQGRQQCRVEAPGYAHLVLGIPEAETAVVARLVPGLEVAGKVTWGEGAPAAAVTVWAGSARVSWTTAAPDGTFVLRGVPSGPVTVTAEGFQAGVLMRAQATVEAGARDAILRLGPAAGGAARLVVRVLDPDGRPVPRATARLRTQHSSSSTGLSDGRIEWDAPAAGSGDAFVDVYGAIGADGAPLPLGPATVPVPPGAKEVEVRLPTEVAVTGTVRTADGAPVRGVAVSARLATGAAGSNFPMDVSSVRTDASGSFRVGGLGAGDYDLTFGVPPEFAPVKPVRVRGGDRDVEVRLRAGIAVTVTVLDPDGQPVSGAVVSAHAKGSEGGQFPDPRFGRERAAATDARGVTRLRGLDAESTYILDVAGKGDDLGSARIDPWTPRDVTVRLPRIWTVTGVVRDRAGRPVPNAMVARMEGTGGWTGTGTDGEGRFRLEGLPPGPVVLRVALGQIQDFQDASGEVRVAAGTKDVVLTLDVGLELKVRITNPGEYGSPWGSAMLLVRRDGKTMYLNAYGDVTDSFRFQGLRAGDECTFWLAPQGPQSDRSAYAPGLEPGADVRVRVAPGRAITGRLRAPPGTIDLSVGANLDGGLGVGARLQPDGAFEILGLPEGTSWQVSAHGRSADGKTFTGQVAAKPGDSIEIELKPPPEPSK